MYLIEIDSETGYILMDAEKTGWLAIKSFRNLYNQDSGLAKMTAVALYADYLSPLRHYGEKDRMAKVSDTIFSKRDDAFWFNDDVQIAIGDYKTLQYNHVLEEKRILEDNKIEILQQIQNSTDTTLKQNLMSQLKIANKNMQDFDKENSGKDLYGESPVRNNYQLSRLEQKLENKKSFYHVRRIETN